MELFKKQKVECPDPFKDKIKCETCKHWVDKSDCKKVSEEGNPYFSLYCADGGIRTKWYCPEHSPKYDKVQKWPELKYFRTIGEVETDEAGKILTKII